MQYFYILEIKIFSKIVFNIDDCAAHIIYYQYYARHEQSYFVTTDASSVTRLADVLMFCAKNYVIKVAKMCSDFW